MSFEASELYQLLTGDQLGHKACDAALKLLQKSPNLAKLQQDETGDTYLHVLARQTAASSWAGPYMEPVIYALSNAGVEVNAVNKQGDTALHVALAEKGTQYALVRGLLRVGVDPSIQNKEGKDLSNTLERNSMLYKSNSYGINYIDVPGGIWRAVEEGDADAVERLMKGWFRVKVKKGSQMLKHKAVMAGHRKVMEILDRYVSTNELVHAVLAYDIEKMKKLFRVYEDQCDVNTEDASSQGPDHVRPTRTLLTSVLGISLEATKILLDHGADVNHLIDSGPAYLFPGPSNEDTYRAILGKADINLKTTAGNNLLYMLNWNENKKLSEHFVYNLLHKHGVKLLSDRNMDGATVRDYILTQYNSPFASNTKHVKFHRHQCKYLKMMDRVVESMVKHNEWNKLEELIVRGYGQHLKEITDEEGRPLTEVARINGAKDSLEMLESISVYEKQVKNVFRAVREGDEDALNLYMLSVSHTLPRDLGGRSLLHIAVLSGQIGISKILSDSCPYMMNAQDNLNRTPLHYACAIGNSQIQAILKERGCDQTAVDVNGRTAEQYISESEENGHQMAFLEETRSRQYGRQGLLALFYLRLKRASETDDVLSARDTISDMKTEDVTLNDLGELESCGVVRGDDYEPLLFFVGKAVMLGDPGPVEVFKLLLQNGIDYKQKYQYGTCDRSCYDLEFCEHVEKTIGETCGWRVQELVDDYVTNNEQG